MATNPVMFPDIEGPQFERAGDVAEVADEVFAKEGQDRLIPRLFDVRRAIREGDINVLYLRNTKPFDPLSDEARHDAIAKCVKAPTLWHDVTGFDAAIWVRGYFWDQFDEMSRRALLVHELLHLDVSYDDGGAVKLAIRKHDLEEFDDVARHFGAALPGIAEFTRAFARSQGEHPLQATADRFDGDITITGGGKVTTIKSRRPKSSADEPMEEAARSFTADQGAAALDDLNRDLDGES